MMAASVTLAGSLVVKAKQGFGGGAGAGKPLTPLTASSLLLHPELYVGETVSMLATVEKILTPTTFSVDQDKTKPAVKDVLVIAPTLTGAPQLNSYVTIIGDVVKFDSAEIMRRAKGYVLDLPADLIEKYKGQPIIIATAVINAELTDLAKKAPRPATPEENAFDDVMKQVSPTFTALRASVDTSDATVVRQHAAKLKLLFGTTQTFFKSRSTADAVGWAADAERLAGVIDTAAAAAKWDDVKAAATSLNTVCQTCHAAYRERQDDGTYRVKSSK
jgi:cytochrome c556